MALKLLPVLGHPEPDVRLRRRAARRMADRGQAGHLAGDHDVRLDLGFQVVHHGGSPGVASRVGAARARGDHHAAVSGQTECSSVTSFQCRWTAICCSGVNQSPAIESPARATVSTGCEVSP